jgi:hypothetical protein
MDTLATSLADDFADARAAFEQGRLREAADTFARIFAADARHAESVRHLGLIAYRIGNHAQAAELIAQSIMLNPAAAAYADLAHVMRALGQYQSAREAARIASAMGFTVPASPPEMRREPSIHAAVPDCWRQVHLVLVEPDNYPHGAGLSEFIVALSHAFAKLGCDAEIVRNRFSKRWMNLVFGAHLISSRDHAAGMPPNSVLVNLEQLRGSRLETNPIYVDLLTRFPVWDYSLRNIAELAALTGNPRVIHMGIGYVPEMRQLPPVAEQSTDVLFYGSINERRRAVLQSLMLAGLRVRHLFGVYGAERDRAIAEAKVVLNMHFFETGIHELIRTSYLLANGKAVVCECNADTEIDDDVRRAMVAVPYAELVGACIGLVGDDARRREVEQGGFALFAERSQSGMLAQAIAATPL